MENLRIEINKLIEQDLEGIDVSCKNNCGACCNQSVMCLPEEVENIMLHTSEIDLDHLEKQITEQDPDMTCIFLKNNSCSIYDIRPLMCRSYFVTTPSENCGTEVPARRVPMYKTIEKLKEIFDIFGRVTLHKSIYLRLKNGIQ